MEGKEFYKTTVPTNRTTSCQSPKDDSTDICTLAWRCMLRFKQISSKSIQVLWFKKCASSVQFTNYNKCSQPETLFSTKEHTGDKKNSNPH
jgi:hypothetical protein